MKRSFTVTVLVRGGAPPGEEKPTKITLSSIAPFTPLVVVVAGKIAEKLKAS